MSIFKKHLIKALSIYFVTFLVSFTAQGQTPLYKTIDKSNGLPSNFVYRVLEDIDGSIWICTDGGVCKYDGKTMNCFDETNGLPDKDIYKITLDDLGRLWLFHVGNKITFIQNDSVHVYSTTSKSTTQRQYRNQGAEQGIKIGDGYYAIDGENNVKKEPVPYGARFTQGLLWGDMYIFDSTKRDSCLVLDLKKGSKIFLPDVDVVVQSISQFHHPTQTFQIYTGHKIYVYDTLLSLQEIVDVNFSKDLNIHSALRDRWGNLWVCSRKGIYFQSYTQRKHSIKLQDDTKGINVIKILEGKNGTIIVDENGGVHKQEAGILRTINKGDIHSGLVYNVEINGDYLYLSGGHKGFVRINISHNVRSSFEEIAKGSKKFVFVDSIRTFVAGYVLREIDINTKNAIDIKTDFYKEISYDNKNKTIWVTTSDSLFIYNDLDQIKLYKSISFPLIENIKYIGNGKTIITTSESRNYICRDTNCEELNFAEDVHIRSISVSMDTVWLNTEKGILKSRFNIHSNAAFVFEPYFNYSSLQSNVTVNDISVHNDFVLLGTDDGLIRINELEIPIKTTSIPIGINLINKRVIDTSNVILEYKDRNLTIDYNINYFTTRDQLHFECYLEGTEVDSIFTDDQVMRYLDLASGNYIFKVKAKDTFGNESELAALSIFIKKPWYQRPSIYIVGLLLLSGIGYLLFRWYITRLNKANEFQRQFAELELSALQSQMNPHFVFNAMNSIQNLIASNRPEEADLYVTRLATLMRKYLESSKEKYITISEELEIVKLYLELEELRFGNKISYRIDNQLDPEYSSMDIPATIVQPFVENSLKHGLFHKKEKGNLYLRLYDDGSNIYIEIEDDGVGRRRVKEIQDSSKRMHKSTGMKSIETKLEVLRKVDKIDVECTVIDLYEENVACGTKVIIRMSNK